MILTVSAVHMEQDRGAFKVNYGSQSVMSGGFSQHRQFLAKIDETADGYLLPQN
jgi:hypothetical protein